MIRLQFGKKSDLTGAVGSIQVDKVQGISVKSVDQMLQGRTSGLYMVGNSGMPGASSPSVSVAVTLFPAVMNRCISSTACRFIQCGCKSDGIKPAEFNPDIGY